MAYKLVTDGSTDMNVEFMKTSDIVVVPMDSTMDGEVYSFLSTDIEQLNKYYEFMLNDKNVSTTQVNQARFEEYFEQILKEGFDFIYAGLTSGLSGTYDNAVKAKESLEKKYPERKITVLELYTACTGSGVLFQQLQEFKNNGMEYDEMVEWIEKNSKYLTAQFAVDDLKYLYKGGRVSKTTAGVGNLLNVKPLLHVDYYGKLQVLGLSRGTKNTIKQLLKNFDSSWMPEISDMVVIGYAYYRENAESLKEAIEEKYPKARVTIAPIGSLIGTHVGPGMFSLSYCASKR